MRPRHRLALPARCSDLRRARGRVASDSPRLSASSNGLIAGADSEGSLTHASVGGSARLAARRRRTRKPRTIAFIAVAAAFSIWSVARRFIDSCAMASCTSWSKLDANCAREGSSTPESCMMRGSKLS